MTWMTSSDFNEMPNTPIDEPCVFTPEATIAHRYILQQQMNAGSIPAIWLAHDQATSSTVWLHQIPLEHSMPEIDRQQIRATLRRLQNVPHPRIVRTHSVEFVDSHAIIATDPLHEPLFAAFSKERLQQHDIVRILRHIAAGLAHIHSHNIPCGTLTPGGLDHSDNGTSLAFAGLSALAAFARTPFPVDAQFRSGYRPPELNRGKPYSLQSDYFQFGALMWELLIGSPPPEHPLSALEERTGIPQYLREIMASCLHALPEERATSFPSILAALRKFDRETHNPQFLNTIVRMPTVPNKGKGNPDDFGPLLQSTGHIQTPITEPLFPQHAATRAFRQPEDHRKEHRQFEHLPDYTLDHAHAYNKDPMNRPYSNDFADIRSLVTEQIPVPDITRDSNSVQQTNTDQTVQQRIPFLMRDIRILQTSKSIKNLMAVVATVLVALTIWGLGISKAIAGHTQLQNVGDITINNTTTVVPTRTAPYRITRSIVLGPGQTLQIKAGVTLIFSPDVGIILRGGTLDAEGSSEKPILLTASQDPAASGKKPGYWLGISLDAGSDGTTGKIIMSEATIADAGNQTGAAIACTSGALTITNSIQTGSAGIGIEAAMQCWGEVTKVTFQNDAGNVATIQSSIMQFHDNILNGGKVALP